MHACACRQYGNIQWFSFFSLRFNKKDFSRQALQSQIVLDLKQDLFEEFTLLQLISHVMIPRFAVAFPANHEEQLKNLHRIASPQEYRRYFDKIFDFAERQPDCTA